MTNNRGTSFLSVPIQFHIGSSRLNWRIIHHDGEILFVGSSLSGATLENIDLGDAWDLVRRYLGVRARDEQAVLRFLAAHGWFKTPEGSTTTGRVNMKDSLRSDQPEVLLDFFTIQDFATIQDYVRRMLITHNPTLPTPWPSGSIQRYEIAFADNRSDSKAHVSVRGVFPSILAIVQFKLVQGANFRVCARKDCRLPFEITSRHDRRFCIQYCAHITSLRQRRRLETTRKKVSGCRSQKSQ
jgi:hypothetical protein